MGAGSRAGKLQREQTQAGRWARAAGRANCPAHVQARTGQGGCPGRRNIAILSKCSRSGMQRETGQAFFLAGSIKPPLRKQRTGFFSQLSGNVPLKKKAPARLAAARDSEQRKAPKTLSSMINSQPAAQLLPEFFLKMPPNTVARTILCPLFSLHPQNQSLKNKSLSSLPSRR